MKRVVLEDAEAVARKGARRIAVYARERLEESERFHLAWSGGRTPWRMLEQLAREDLPWERVHLYQVDERLVASDHPDRNWRQLRRSFADRVATPAENLHPIPVERGDPDEVVAAYAATLEREMGPEPVLDLVHLGLGDDGHTASLVPGDAILEVEDRDVAVTAGAYQGHRRVFFTFPVLRRARKLLWIVTGRTKHAALERLERSDVGIPAGRLGGCPSTLLTELPAV